MNFVLSELLRSSFSSVMKITRGQERISIDSGYPVTNGFVKKKGLGHDIWSYFKSLKDACKSMET